MFHNFLEESVYNTPTDLLTRKVILHLVYVHNEPLPHEFRLHLSLNNLTVEESSFVNALELLSFDERKLKFIRNAFSVVDQTIRETERSEKLHRIMKNIGGLWETTLDFHQKKKEVLVRDLRYNEDFFPAYIAAGLDGKMMASLFKDLHRIMTTLSLDDDVQTPTLDFNTVRDLFVAALGLYTQRLKGSPMNKQVLEALKDSFMSCVAENMELVANDYLPDDWSDCEGLAAFMTRFYFQEAKRQGVELGEEIESALKETLETAGVSIEDRQDGEEVSHAKDAADQEVQGESRDENSEKAGETVSRSSMPEDTKLKHPSNERLNAKFDQISIDRTFVKEISDAENSTKVNIGNEGGYAADCDGSDSDVSDMKI